MTRTNSIVKSAEQIEKESKLFTKEVLKKIGAYMLEGLSEEEACTLAGYDPDVFHHAKENDKNIQLYLDKQRIQFKHQHLQIINGKKSDKNSMWLLEKTLPEFGPKRNQTPDDALSLFSRIIRDIQNDHQTSEIVTIPSEDVTVKKKITEVLSVASALK